MWNPPSANIQKEGIIMAHAKVAEAVMIVTVVTAVTAVTVARMTAEGMTTGNCLSD